MLGDELFTSFTSIITVGRVETLGLVVIGGSGRERGHIQTLSLLYGSQLTVDRVNSAQRDERSGKQQQQYKVTGEQEQGVTGSAQVGD